jgi:response regulator RpfG family c-di-GMP phosphodiesterase
MLLESYQGLYSSASTTPDASDAEQHPFNILIVDDSQAHRLLMKKNLLRAIAQAGIHEAESGKDCFEQMGNTRHDLVLLDYSLPDTTGLEVLGRLRKEYAHVPVIMVTGQGNEQIIHEAVRLGASDYIVKDDGFLENLTRVVERTRVQQALKAQLDHSKKEILLRSGELAILLDATMAISSHLDLDRVLSILSEQINRAINCTFVKILLLVEGGRTLVVKSVFPIIPLEWDPALGHRFDLKPGSPLLSVVSDRTPTMLHREQILDLDADPTLKLGLIGNLERIQSLLIMPITMQGECLGMAVAGERREWERSPITDDKSGLAMALIQHAGIAIKNAYHVQSLQRAYLQTVIGLTEALEARDAATRGHSERSVEYATEIARKLGLSHEQGERLQYAAILHDIGKLGIPDNILNKPGKLTDEEFAVMKTHPVKGDAIVAKIPFLAHVGPLIRHHHERWDGKGYPDGLAGVNIPIESRIIAVLDSYEAMTSDRVYRKAPGKQFAISELRRCSGTQYDPAAVAAFLAIIEDPAGQEDGSLDKTASRSAV